MKNSAVRTKYPPSLGAQSTSCAVKNILNKKRNPEELIQGSLKTKQVVGIVSHKLQSSVGNGKLPKKSKPQHIEIETFDEESENKMDTQRVPKSGLIDSRPTNRETYKDKMKWEGDRHKVRLVREINLRFGFLKQVLKLIVQYPESGTGLVSSTSKNLKLGTGAHPQDKI